MNTLLKRVADDYKGILALTGAFALGATLSLSAMGFTARMDALEGEVTTNGQIDSLQHDATTARLERIEEAIEKLTTNVCILTKLEQGENVLGCGIG